MSCPLIFSCVSDVAPLSSLSVSIVCPGNAVWLLMHASCCGSVSTIALFPTSRSLVLVPLSLWLVCLCATQSTCARSLAVILAFVCLLWKCASASCLTFASIGSMSSSWPVVLHVLVPFSFDTKSLLDMPICSMPVLLGPVSYSLRIGCVRVCVFASLTVCIGCVEMMRWTFVYTLLSWVVRVDCVCVPPPPRGHHWPANGSQ